MIEGDFMIPEAAPLPLAHGLLAAEMGMNLQMALGWRRHLLLHASAAEKDGKALVMTGESGSGKSTLSALLGNRGWRFMGDEFSLVDLDTGDCVPYPRLISLKNQAIAAMETEAPRGRFGPLLKATPKGDIRHLVPQNEAIAKMNQPAKPALLLFPCFGYTPEIRDMLPSETFMRLTQASSNLVGLGEPGFDALTRFVDEVPAYAVYYQTGDQAEEMIDQLWAKLS
jgi:HprK-related kinase A